MSLDSEQQPQIPAEPANNLPKNYGSLFQVTGPSRIRLVEQAEEGANTAEPSVVRRLSFY